MSPRSRSAESRDLEIGEALSGGGCCGLPMNPLTAVPATDPTEIYRIRDGLYGVDLLTAGIVHLDFFTWLADHPSTLGSITVHFGIHLRPADVMMTLFTAMGLVTQAGGCYHLTLRAREHLVKGSPWYLAPYYAALKDRPTTRRHCRTPANPRCHGFRSASPRRTPRRSSRSCPRVWRTDRSAGTCRP